MRRNVGADRGKVGAMSDGDVDGERGAGPQDKKVQ